MKLKCGCLAVLCIAATIGCDSTDTPTGPIPPSDQPSLVRDLPNLVSLRPRELHRYGALAEVPGFAGLFLTEDNVLHVRLADQRGREVAAPHVSELRQRGVITRGGSRVQPSLQWLSADFSLTELTAWRRAIRKHLAEFGIRQLWIDDSDNRIVLGFYNPPDRSVVDLWIGQLGIPPEAVVVRAVDRLDRVSTLEDYNIRLRAGQRISNDSGNACTLGGTFYFPSLVGRRFLTASHCSLEEGHYPSQYPTDDTEFRLVDGFGSYIGDEMIDGAWLARSDVTQYGDCGLECDCPFGQWCRYADVTILNAHYDAWPGDLWETEDASNTIVSTYASPYVPNPFYWNMESIEGRSTVPLFEGHGLYITGAMSGKLWGSIIDDCVDVEIKTGHYYLCMSLAQMESGLAKGDSGAPVWVPSGQFSYLYIEDNAVFMGILSSRGRNDTSLAAFSHSQNIDWEFGFGFPEGS